MDNQNKIEDISNLMFVLQVAIVLLIVLITFLLCSISPLLAIIPVVLTYVALHFEKTLVDNLTNEELDVKVTKFKEDTFSFIGKHESELVLGLTVFLTTLLMFFMIGELFSEDSNGTGLIFATTFITLIVFDYLEYKKIELPWTKWLNKLTSKKEENKKDQPDEKL